MSESRDRIVIVLPVVPLLPGQAFPVERWPLHVTVVAPFTPAGEASVEDVLCALCPVAARWQPFELTAGAEEWFGRRRDVLVNLVQQPESLLRFHDEIVDALGAMAPSAPQHGFAPHITAKKHGRVVEGERIRLASLAAVDMAPRADPKGRRVLGVLPLSAGA